MPIGNRIPQARLDIQMSIAVKICSRLILQCSSGTAFCPTSGWSVINKVKTKKVSAQQRESDSILIITWQSWVMLMWISQQRLTGLWNIASTLCVGFQMRAFILSPFHFPLFGISLSHLKRMLTGWASWCPLKVMLILLKKTTHWTVWSFLKSSNCLSLRNLGYSFCPQEAW